MTGWDDEVPPVVADDGAPAAGGGWDDPPEGDGAAVTMEPEADAARLLQALLAVPAGEPLTVDASAVEHLPLPAAQVLLSAARHGQASGRPLIVRNPSFALNLAFEALGFSDADEPFTVEYA